MLWKKINIEIIRYIYFILVILSFIIWVIAEGPLGCEKLRIYVGYLFIIDLILLILYDVLYRLKKKKK